MRAISKTIGVFAVALLFASMALAAVLLGNHIFDSSFADNPENVLSDDYNYARMRVPDANLLDCPSGFTKTSNTCTLGGQKIGGWLVVDFTSDQNTVLDANAVLVRQSDLNFSGDDRNGVRLGVKVFTTADLDANSLSWSYRGECIINGGQTEQECTRTFSASSVEGVLIGRIMPSAFGSYIVSNNDPAVHVVKLRTQ
jgi:hypothetical protein